MNTTIRRVLVVAGLAAVLSLAACERAAPTASSAPARHDDLQTLAASADEGTFLTGTIATLGSFEWDAAPLQNLGATKLHGIALAAKRGQLTREEGQKRIHAVDGAYNLVLQAIVACNQNPKTGKCRGNEADARKLLDQSRAAFSALP